MQSLISRCAPCLLWGILVSVACADPSSAQKTFKADVLPLLKQYCFDCHGDGADEGGLELETLKATDIKRWHTVWKNLKHELMPPPDADAPSDEERLKIRGWIEQQVMQLDPKRPDPGAVTIRRLNRQEYKWTIRDVLDVDYETENNFPADDSGYGFDTVGDTQNVAPILTEKYLKAAQQIAEKALPDPTPKNKPQSYKRILFDGSPPEDAGERKKYRREVVERVASKLFRRPIDKRTLNRIIGLSSPDDDGSEHGFEESIRTALTIALVSPRFLFRSEAEGSPKSRSKASSVPLDDYALASRLSYFLWSSAPDDELRRLAEEGTLRDELRPQIDRMVKDSKFDRFVENFVGQWLRTRDVTEWDTEADDILGLSRREANKIFDRDVRRAMKTETHELFEYIVDENRSVRDLLIADYSFLNDELAKFYGIDGVRGRRARKVDLPDDSPRRGVLTHGSVLLVTSNPTRTSPVKRGVFVLDNILGTPAAPAPPFVPELTDAKTEDGKQLTMRQRMEMHRSKPLCASCHARMDPLGLAFESFNALGLHRSEADGQPIKTAGELVTGESFASMRELAEVLANERRDDFYRCLTEKMLIYGLGRGTEYYDIPAVDKIVAALHENDGKARTLFYEIVESAPFQMRRGSNYKPTVAEK